jgi:hypothetical protein
VSYGWRPQAGGSKHDKEIRRLLKREAKSEKARIREAEKLNGVEIDTLPEDIQGLARTLTNIGRIEP